MPPAFQVSLKKLEFMLWFSNSLFCSPRKAPKLRGFFVLFCLLCFFVETWPSLDFHSRSSCLSLLSARITDVCYHTWPKPYFLSMHPARPMCGSWPSLQAGCEGSVAPLPDSLSPSPVLQVVTPGGLCGAGDRDHTWTGHVACPKGPRAGALCHSDTSRSASEVHRDGTVGRGAG
jgi:hypothetical protein